MNRLAEPGAALDAALELADAIAKNGPLALIASKRILIEEPGWSEDEKWQKQGEISGPGVRLGGRPRGRHRLRREARSGMEGSLKGQLLIAAPQLADYFRRTVVLVLEHTRGGRDGRGAQPPDRDTAWPRRCRTWPSRPATTRWCTRAGRSSPTAVLALGRVAATGRS